MGKEKPDLIKLLNLSGNLTLEDIDKIREYNNKQTEGMSVEEINEYYNDAEKRFFEKAEKAGKLLEKETRNPKLISKDILLYYKSLSKDNYIELINNDLKKMIELRKSL